MCSYLRSASLGSTLTGMQSSSTKILLCTVRVLKSHHVVNMLLFSPTPSPSIHRPGLRWAATASHRETPQSGRETSAAPSELKASSWCRISRTTPLTLIKSFAGPGGWYQEVRISHNLKPVVVLGNNERHNTLNASCNVFKNKNKRTSPRSCIFKEMKLWLIFMYQPANKMTKNLFQQNQNFCG